MSVRKDCRAAFGIHPIPANVSKEDFEAKCEALVESFLEVPVAQRNLLKFDILLQNSELSELLSEFGMPQPRPVVCMRCEYETEAHWAECLRDPDLVKAMDAGRPWGFHDGASIFTIDVINKSSHVLSGSSKVAVAVFTVPRDVSPGTFRTKMEALVEEIHKAANNPKLVTDIYIQTTHAEENLQAAGYPASQPMLVVICESKTWDEILKAPQNPKVMNVFRAAIKEFDFHADSVCFSADVITKLKRSGA